MGRPKEFDPEQALDRAMEVFWRQGFEATSVQDLVEHMGINRGSLYDTFGDKKTLFFKVLDRYTEQVAQELIDALGQPGSARKVIADTFKRVVEECSKSDRRGCLMVNAAVEMAQHCSQTASRVSAAVARSEEALRGLLERGRQSGELPETVEPRALARFFVTVLQGLVVMGKANASRATLRDAVKVALSALDRP